MEFMHPSSNTMNQSTSDLSYSHISPRSKEVRPEISPYFHPTHAFFEVMSSQSELLAIELHVKGDKGFYQDPSGEFYCYRRNYFAISAGFELLGHHEPSDPVFLNYQGMLQPIKSFSIGIRAQSGDGQRKIPIVAHTAKRDKGPQMIPAPQFVRDGGNPSINRSNLAIFERLQFKLSTAQPASRRKSTSPFYSLFVELIATLSNDMQVIIAIRESDALVVRARSAAHYLDVEVPGGKSEIVSAMGMKSGYSESAFVSPYSSLTAKAYDYGFAAKSILDTTPDSSEYNGSFFQPGPQSNGYSSKQNMSISSLVNVPAVFEDIEPFGLSHDMHGNGTDMGDAYFDLESIHPSITENQMYM